MNITTENYRFDGQFFETMFFILFALKLMGKLSCSWLIITAPLLIEFSIIIIMLLAMLISSKREDKNVQFSMKKFDVLNKED